MPDEFGVVDLFAGPGGLAEGFANVRRKDGTRPFSIALSIEKEYSAHQTLTLRSFLRQFQDDPPEEYFHSLNNGLPFPDWSRLYPHEWLLATEEALLLEMGSESTAIEINRRIDRIREQFGGRVVLIGGPPCQAYSLVGRSRNMGNVSYSAINDSRHYLYQEYIRILKRLQPAIFVMENVKGILSSKVGEEKIFEKILDDLREIEFDGRGYELVPLKDGGETGLRGMQRPSDFVVRAEDYGVPQTRHRVIVVGLHPNVAEDLSWEEKHGGLLARSQLPAKVDHVLSNMPRMRSGLSKGGDDFARWRAAVASAMQMVHDQVDPLVEPEITERIRQYQCQHMTSEAIHSRNEVAPNGIGDRCSPILRTWIINPRLNILPNNETRAHIASDLARYFFTAVLADVHDRSPKASEYPLALAPEHRNWNSGKFADRFRVQRWNHPSSTVTSHISKDGHYFIHPDPLQCRSLTVREAARLQTFPDDYLFLGNRTQQYVQVGNAVPPFLAKQIAESILGLLGIQEAPKSMSLKSPPITSLVRET